ncbi:MAG TPA: ABC transporter permease [Rhodocyclaceae bacterium]|nr:ABC transporter permease [Rhodocyclaceae bacterium]
MSLLSSRRLWALCRKESYQIVRDPSSILIAFILPVIMLFIFGYAINLDADHVRLGLLIDDTGPAARRLEQTLRASSAFETHKLASREEMQAAMARGELRGVVIVQSDFSAKWLQGQGAAAIQVLTDGSEPNTASFVAAYIQGSWEKWQQEMALDKGEQTQPVVDLRMRVWFNPSANSRNFLVPGSIAVVMTIIGALLTSLVVAREWERGTMEALLATPATRAELLLSKIIPYYALGMIAMLLCLLVAVLVMEVPFRGSLPALMAISTLFLGSALGLGLFLSTAFRNQFNAAQAALVAGFLPAMMLSGFVFEISSMPTALQWLTHLIPARYLTNSLQTLFQAGTIPMLLSSNAVWLAALAAFWLVLTAKKTKRTLD